MLPRRRVLKPGQEKKLRRKYRKLKMPKLKTRKSIKKRFHITGSGKIMHMHQGKSHLRLRKSKRVKRSYGQEKEMASANQKRILRLLPHTLK